ncbi:MAG: hypothetical protein RL649_812, partial [Actinomycetota bacterium]
QLLVRQSMASLQSEARLQLRHRKRR